MLGMAVADRGTQNEFRADGKNDGEDHRPEPLVGMETAMAVAMAVSGVAQDCSNPNTVCPTTFQIVRSVVKYQSANRRSLGFLLLPC